MINEFKQFTGRQQKQALRSAMIITKHGYANYQSAVNYKRVIYFLDGFTLLTKYEQVELYRQMQEERHGRA